MDPTFDLENKPLARALIAYAVKSTAPDAEPGAAGMPKTHLELLQTGATRMAFKITDIALRLLGRSSLSSSAALPEEAPIIIGFSLLILFGIAQAVGKEGVVLDTGEMAEKLIEEHLARRIKAAGSDDAVKRHIAEISAVATQIPGQIVATAKGEVEELFRTCYAVLPEYIEGNDETRRQLMPIFGTALLLLLQAQIKTND